MEYRRNARRDDREYSLTDDEARAIMSRPCHYCGYKGSPYIGMDRKDNALGYTISNVVACCTTCNTAKMAMSYEAFWAHQHRVAAYINKITFTY